MPSDRRALWSRRARRSGIALAAVLTLGLLWPARTVIPVRGATAADWNHATFWHHPWGASGVHKGIDIFAAEGTPVVASTGGMVVYSGPMGRGGNVVVVFGPAWRAHYYAHLSARWVDVGDLLRAGDGLGRVGSTGNAAGKPAHLHYSIATVVPYPWRWTWEPQGWKKTLYLDPDAILRSNT